MRDWFTSLSQEWMFWRRYDDWVSHRLLASSSQVCEYWSNFSFEFRFPFVHSPHFVWIPREYSFNFKRNFLLHLFCQLSSSAGFLFPTCNHQFHPFPLSQASASDLYWKKVSRCSHKGNLRQSFQQWSHKMEKICHFQANPTMLLFFLNRTSLPYVIW